MDQPPLSVALLTNGSTLPAWLAQTIAAVEDAQGLRVARILQLAPPALHGRPLEHVYRRLQHAAESLRDASRAEQTDTVEAQLRFRSAVVETLRLEHGGTSEILRVDGIDLVVNCGVDATRAQRVLGRMGSLSWDFSGMPAALALFRAVVHEDRTLRIAVRLFDGQQEQLIEQARPALPERPLLGQTEEGVYRRASVLVAKALCKLIADDRGATQLPTAGSEVAGEANELHPASTLSVARYVARRGARSLRSRLRRGQGHLDCWRNGHNWFLAYRTNASDFVCNTERFDARGFRLLLPPADRAYADPCVVSRHGVEHVFFEDWDPETDKGVIAWTRMGPDGLLLQPETVLEEDYHLSYPFVFEDDGDMFMIPESAAAKSVDLYKAVDFPRRWKKVATLLHNVAAADPTVLRYQGRWWMFVTVGEQGSSKCDQLRIYHADSLYGPWRGHRANPVKIDVTSARPAGRLFRRGNQLIRPSQDCSITYGGALTLNRVTRLTPEAFEEIPIARLTPDWLPHNRGLHTLSHTERLEVIDGMMLPEGEVRFPGAAMVRS